MPRNETRPIVYAPHAEERIVERGISKPEVEQIVRHGALRPDPAAFGEKKWIASGWWNGRNIEIPFVETMRPMEDGTVVRVIEVLLVITVMERNKR